MASYGYPGGRVRKALAQLGLNQLNQIQKVTIDTDTITVQKKSKRGNIVTTEYPIAWRRDQ